MLEKLKKTRIAQWFKKARVWQMIKQSYGDWRYPFMLLSWQLVKLFVPRKKVSVDGVSFTLPCINWVTHFRWYLFEKKESEVRSYIDNYIEEGDVFFDVGANIGVFSIYAAKRHENIICHCFEPEYSNLYLLKENIIENKLIDKVNIVSAAIGNFVGFSKLNIQDFTPASAAHTESKEEIKITDEGYAVVWAEGIMSVTIDYMCQQLKVVPNALKIDTDGNEDKVLEGAVETLCDKRLRSIVIEMPDENEKGQYCCQMLENAKFSLVWSDHENTRNQIWAKNGM